MRYAILLVLLAGCETVAEIDRADIIADIAVRTATLWHQPPAIPDTPRDGCEPDCTCNGTGREKTGDGLSTVDCRCDDDCDCKASNSPEIPDSPTAADPPIVPIQQQECESGNCQPVQSVRRWRLFR